MSQKGSIYKQMVLFKTTGNIKDYGLNHKDMVPWNYRVAAGPFEEHSSWCEKLEEALNVLL